MKDKSEVVQYEIINSFNEFFNNTSKKLLEITVALSGGVDSIVLLHALNELKSKLKIN